MRSEGVECVAGEAHDAPLGLHAGAEAVVDGDGGFVPVEDVPLEAWAAFVDRDLRETSQQGAANSLPAQRGCDVEVFKADAVMAEPGGVAVEEECEAGGSGCGADSSSPPEISSAMSARKRAGVSSAVPSGASEKPSRRRSASVAMTASGSRS